MRTIGPKLPLTVRRLVFIISEMTTIQKACPIVTRATERGPDILAFRHPWAGCQLVKGTIDADEQPQHAAKRELFEESGLICPTEMTSLGTLDVGPERMTWHLFAWHSTGLPDHWEHATTDDGGHTFAFFWHPIDMPLDEEWHPIFREVFPSVVSRLTRL